MAARQRLLSPLLVGYILEQTEIHHNESKLRADPAVNSCCPRMQATSLHVMLLRQDIYYNDLTTAVCTTNNTLAVLSMKAYITRKVIPKVATLPIDNMQVYIQEMLL